VPIIRAFTINEGAERASFEGKFINNNFTKYDLCVGYQHIEDSKSRDQRLLLPNKGIGLYIAIAERKKGKFRVAAYRFYPPQPDREKQEYTIQLSHGKNLEKNIEHAWTGKLETYANRQYETKTGIVIDLNSKKTKELSTSGFRVDIWEKIIEPELDVNALTPPEEEGLPGGGCLEPRFYD
jgi:hypothetical protein